jgi:hypothetical protein
MMLVGITHEKQIRRKERQEGETKEEGKEDEKYMMEYNGP